MMGRFAGAGAALCWTVFTLAWFDVAAAWPPPWARPVGWLAAAAGAASLGVWLYARRGQLADPAPPGDGRELLLAVAAAVALRLPLALHGAAGYLTADGALSGIVALHLRDGIERLVFVPQVPYSGSLKSHLTAPLAALIDPARAFALVSVGFYALFVAGVHRLGRLADGARPGTALAAALYAAFAPAFVTRYSLSNDGNYVEVLALGTWALALAAGWVRAGEPFARTLVIGCLLGLAFWCHILAVSHAAAVSVFFLAVAARRVLRWGPALLGGFALGDLPGLVWNAANGWASFAYLAPGGPAVGGAGEDPGLVRKAALLVTNHLAVLLGYDPGYPAAIDVALRILAAGAVAATAFGVVSAVRAARDPGAHALRLLLAFTAVTVAVAVIALPYIPGNPRYLLFLAAPVSVFLARALVGRARALLAVLVVGGALGSLAQAPGAAQADAAWRALVGELRAEGVRFCYTDFYLATKINFLSQEDVVCSSKLGPTTTEYFFDYRRRVDAAPEAALVAVNTASVEKLERRLSRLGVTWQRRDLMKPVLFRLSRKVDPGELFPDREFPLR